MRKLVFLGLLLLFSTNAFAAKAYVVIKGFAYQNGQVMVVFDAVGSPYSLLTEEKLPIDLTATAGATSLAVRTAAAQRCNQADPSLNLTASDFILQ